jgi:ribosomal peptide maturation radical SAM protein 1
VDASKRIGAVLGGGEALIVVPPFASLNRPCLGAHVLQACARERGFRVSILYANLLLAAEIGEQNYFIICEADHRTSLLGERFFSAVAYGTPLLGHDHGMGLEKLFKEHRWELKLDVYRRLAALVPQWVDRLAEAIQRSSYDVVGCTSSFEQNAASVALLHAIKRGSPQVIAVVGGANCQGEMARGVLSLSPSLDYVFSGECEDAFPLFLQEVREGDRPTDRIIQGRPCWQLDRLPRPDYSEYYEQLHRFLPLSAMERARKVAFAYETSRGCWWGEKHHCTFCGLNDDMMAFRKKSPDRVIEDLKALGAAHQLATGCDKVFMVDNIMPSEYFRTLLPRLAEEGLSLDIFFEQKANLSLGRVCALKRAGVSRIQPGIEALSTRLLRLMDKGVTSPQNIALLRYARAVDIRLDWNLLYGFPKDELEMYAETLELIPLLRHLEPPNRMGRLRIDRFSPYFERPQQYGIQNLRPLPIYAIVLPREVDATQVAYHFDGDYASASLEDPGLMRALTREVDDWLASWQEDGLRAVLEVVQLEDDRYELRDTRGLAGTEKVLPLSPEKAAQVLIPRRADRMPENVFRWAVDRKLAVELDGYYVPLPTASPSILLAFETSFAGSRSTPLATA